MCRPPDLLPGTEAIEYEGDDIDDWDQNAQVLEAAAAQLQASTSLLGKRQLGELGPDDLSDAAKLQRTATPAVSSAFDSAAASFMARMEHSMLQDLQRKQQEEQQRRLTAAVAAAAAAESEESLLLQKALLEQKAKVQQLQQLQLLNQLQANSKARSLLPEQQQLLLAQQQLLKHSQAKAALPAASMVKQEPQWSAAQGAALPPTLIQPAPAAGLSSLLAAKANPASALLGFGAQSLSAFQTAAMVLDDEKKVKRMQSNRASAKRSRQRRQARLDELDKTTGQLQAENSTLCEKLEQAQQQIHELEEKNRSLVGEVSDLRKMLGMPAYSSSDEKVSAPSSQCLASESCAHGSFGSAPVKTEATEATTSLDEVDGVDQFDSLFDLDSCDGGLDQLLPQGDVLSELLACLDG